jgi:hypothetical protein
VTLENVASRECVPAENTHVGAVTSVYRARSAYTMISRDDDANIEDLRRRRWRFKCLAWRYVLVQ